MIRLETLAGFSFFAGLDEAELKSLSIIANRVSFRRGDVIFREDDPAVALYFILDGWVDIMINVGARGSHRELVTTLTSGEIFGWSAVVEPYVYTASAICASPVEAVSFKGVDLLALFEIDPRLCCAVVKKVCQVIARRLRATRLQMVSLGVTG